MNFTLSEFHSGEFHSGEFHSGEFHSGELGMQAIDWDRNKQKKGATFANYITVEWTENVARFSEMLQIVDILDCLGLIYGSVTSATSAQTRFFGGKTLASTETKMHKNRDTLLWKVRWNDSGRARIAMKVPDMCKFLNNVIGNSLPKSKELAKLLNVDELTAMGACSAVGTLPKAMNTTLHGDVQPYALATVPVHTDNSTATVQPTSSTPATASQSTAKSPLDICKISVQDVAQMVAPKRMEKTFQLYLEATNAESAARIMVAHNRASIDAKEREYYEEKSKKRRLVDTEIEEERLQEGKKAAKLEFLVSRIKSLEALGEMGEAAKLRKRLIEGTP